MDNRLCHHFFPLCTIFFAFYFIRLPGFVYIGKSFTGGVIVNVVAIMTVVVAVVVVLRAVAVVVVVVVIDIVLV